MTFPHVPSSYLTLFYGEFLLSVVLRSACLTSIGFSARYEAPVSAKGDDVRLDLEDVVK